MYLQQPLEFNGCRKGQLRQQTRCAVKESGSREQRREETEAKLDKGSKRTAEEAEPLEEAPNGKRVRVTGKHQTGSPAALTVPVDDEIIDVEDVSVIGADEGAILGRLTSDFGLGESEEAASSSDEIISVGEVDCDQSAGDLRSITRSPEDTEVDVIGGFDP